MTSDFLHYLRKAIKFDNENSNLFTHLIKKKHLHYESDQLKI